MAIDEELIRDARRLINAANVHAIGGWLLAYEAFPPDTPKSKKLERMLRDFVRTMTLRKFLQKKAASEREKLNNLLLANH